MDRSGNRLFASTRDDLYSCLGSNGRTVKVSKRGWGDQEDREYASFSEWVMLISMIAMIAALLLLAGK